MSCSARSSPCSSTRSPVQRAQTRTGVRSPARRGRSEDREMTLPPGPRLPTLAQTLDWVYRPARFMRRARQATATISRSLAGPERLGVGAGGVHLRSEPVKTIFTADPSLAPAAPVARRWSPCSAPRSVLLIDGRAHMRQRKLMLPPFTASASRANGALMGEITREELARWPERGAFELQARMQAITLEINPARRLRPRGRRAPRGSPHPHPAPARHRRQSAHGAVRRAA